MTGGSSSCWCATAKSTAGPLSFSKSGGGRIVLAGDALQQRDDAAGCRPSLPSGGGMMGEYRAARAEPDGGADDQTTPNAERKHGDGEGIKIRIDVPNRRRRWR